MADDASDHGDCGPNSDWTRYEYGMPPTCIGVACKECSVEFVREDLIPEESRREIHTVENMRFYRVFKRQIHDENSQLMIRKTKLRADVNLQKLIKYGDHICFDRNMGLYTHHAIVTAVKPLESRSVKVDLVHWQSGSPFEIKKDSDVDLRALYGQWFYRCDYPDDALKADDRKLTVARALAYVGLIDRYNFLTENCEHFAVFCKIGSNKSWQVRRAFDRMISFLRNSASSCSPVVAGALTKAGIAVAGDLVEAVVTKGGSAFLSAGTQAIGFGISVSVNGARFALDWAELNKMFKGNPRKRNEKRWESFLTFLERVVFTGVLPAAGALLLGAAASNPATWVTVGVLLCGALVGGALASAVEGFGHTFAGSIMSQLTRGFTWFMYSDKRIDNIRELTMGDHAVLSGWLLHPRCHIIVIDINEDENKINAIRFTYGDGVVKQCLDFQAPVYKLIYEIETYNPEEVVERAERMLASNNLTYDILQNNCKSFAFWCKKGKRPFSLTQQLGYD